MSPLDAVAHAYDTGGFTTRSDFIRAHSEAVAEAACLGLLTTQQLDGTFGACWRPTPLGLTLLFKDVPSNEESLARLSGRAATGDSRLFGDNYTG